MMMGDERAVRATYVMGERQHPGQSRLTDIASSTTRRSP
jgi:hypothetical protein